MRTNLERIRALDAEAVRLSAGLVRQTTVADLARDTPCAGWDLADLLAHMTAQHHGFAAAARGSGGDLAAWAPAPAADPIAAYAAAADDVIAAFADVTDGGRPFALPEFATDRGFPAAQAIGFHFLDYVVHAWDVATALGVPFTPDADLLDAALPLALAVPPTTTAFAPPLPTPPAADPLARILTKLGRAVRP
ncbi:TIGR03086 family metal-binding protein [Actinacidiphila paucisporea]|uniref:TIGR03086 family protein n=1 Tax=Actinacidiphila paucisporea TaxID=310782 RepID=A0A1M7PVI5_9ACTN|nr:TIGR03086 family metal-binding protein [Actinacidiphila paucisporea]SHN21563.1 TIGR03086 family protein [Actinacidiphila paucisporea]